MKGLHQGREQSNLVLYPLVIKHCSASSRKECKQAPWIGFEPTTFHILEQILSVSFQSQEHPNWTALWVGFEPATFPILKADATFPILKADAICFFSITPSPGASKLKSTMGEIWTSNLPILKADAICFSFSKVPYLRAFKLMKHHGWDLNQQPSPFWNKDVLLFLLDHTVSRSIQTKKHHG